MPGQARLLAFAETEQSVDGGIAAHGHASQSTEPNAGSGFDERGSSSSSMEPSPASPATRAIDACTGTGRIDKSELTFPEPQRMRDKKHLRFVAKQPCLVCGRIPAFAHHITYAQPKALGRKVSDEFTVPLCALHHRSLHTANDERTWWLTFHIDPVAVALRLAAEVENIAGLRANEGAEEGSAQLQGSGAK